MEDLLQKVITKVYQLNKNNGFRANEKSLYIIDVCTRMTEENLKKALEQLEEIEKEG